MRFWHNKIQDDSILLKIYQQNNQTSFSEGKTIFKKICNPVKFDFNKIKSLLVMKKKIIEKYEIR